MWLNSKDASRKNRRGGVDNISPEQFRSRLEENLQKVRERLLSPDFLFSELRPVFIPKGNDRYRVICVPTVADKGYRVFAPEAAFQELDNIVAEVSSFEKATNDANTLGQAVAQLNSRIEGFILAYSPAKNQPQLRDAAYQKRKKALKSLFRDIFGADVLDSLDARKRRFLDLPE